MINLSNPDVRRGARTVVQALVQFALLAFLWALIEALQKDVSSLRLIALSSLGIIAMGELGYMMENSLRAFKLTAGKEGVTVDASGSNQGD